MCNLAATKPTEKADILYYCKVYYEETDDLEYKWQIMFTVVKCLNALQQVIIYTMYKLIVPNYITSVYKTTLSLC